MAEWNRTDYDALEREGRWEMTILSSDPLRGVTAGLIAFLVAVLVALAALTFAG